MSTNRYRIPGTVAVRIHDGDVTNTWYDFAPPKGSGKHYRKGHKYGWSRSGIKPTHKADPYYGAFGRGGRNRGD